MPKKNAKTKSLSPDEGVARAMWCAAIGAKDWAAMTVESGKKSFPLRAGQQQELERWAKAGKFDEEWLLVEGGRPVAFVAQDGTHNALALASAAKTKYGAVPGAGGGARPAKKQKVAAASPSATPAKMKSNKVSGSAAASNGAHPIDASGVLQAAKDGNWKNFKALLKERTELTFADFVRCITATDQSHRLLHISICSAAPKLPNLVPT
eukprot:SAG11_NODE_292_length_11180_cov_6.023825_6_plen_209_part_00